MDFDGRVYPDCPNAGNPFHECNARCFERLNSGEVHKKEKKLLGNFGKKSSSRDIPGSPTHVAGNRSPLPSYYARRMVESSDDSPSFSSSDENIGYFSNRPSPAHGQSSQTKQISGNKAAAARDSLPMSPSLAVYAERDHVTQRPDRRRGETRSHLGMEAEMSPRTPRTRPRTPETHTTPGRWPKTPEHRLRTPDTRPRTPEHRPRTPEHRLRTLETRLRTPEHPSSTPETRPRTPETRPRTPAYRATTPETRPRTPETRPRTPDHRARSPEVTEKSPGLRSRTPEPQARHIENRARTPEPQARKGYIERRARTPEPWTRTQETQLKPHRSLDVGFLPGTSHQAGNRSPQTYYSHGNKAESVYPEDDEDSVLLFPEILLSPQKRPTSRRTRPDRRGHQMPTRQEEIEPQAESESSDDDDDFSFVEENAVYINPEMVSSSNGKPKSGSNTPVHHNFRASVEHEEYEKHNEPPELPDESQSFSLSEIAKMRKIKNYDREEMRSMISESYVSVGNYKVRASISATLQCILDKYGDIASNSKLQSISTRSFYLDSLASVVLQLQSTPLKNLTENRVKEILAIVKDLESVKIQVGWFRTILDELLEAAKHYKQHETTIAEKEVCDSDLVLAKQEMEARMKELVQKEKETRECRERVTEMAGRLGNLEMKRVRMDKSLTFLRSKVEKFLGKSVLEELF